MRRKLLIVSAVTALVAGTTMANAQRTQSQGADGAQGQTGAQQGQTETAKPGESAKPGSDGARRPAQAQPGKPSDGQAQRNEGQGGREVQGQREQTQQQGQQGQREQRQPAQQQSQGQRQGGGASVTLNTEQKTKIRQTVLQGGNAPKVTNVNFSLTVGTAVPTHVHVVTVPQVIVDIHPDWRGFFYFIVGEQIIIVDRNHHIVAVLIV